MNLKLSSVPPQILDKDSSSDVKVPDGGSVTLVCIAKGYPEPKITWRRENKDLQIIVRTPNRGKMKG